MKTIQTLSQLHAIPIADRQEWYIPEALSTSIPITENGESFVELGNFFRERNTPLELRSVTGAPFLYLREGAARRLLEAARALHAVAPRSMMLLVTDAFRSLDLQRKYFEEVKAEIVRAEGLSGRELWERVTQFVADPDLCPPHSTGGAVDVTLVDAETGRELDMGTSVDQVADQSATWHSEISHEAHRNRLSLVNAMTRAGFVNLPTEWWHYSYGDQYWAAFHGPRAALYNSVSSVPLP